MLLNHVARFPGCDKIILIGLGPGDISPELDLDHRVAKRGQYCFIGWAQRGRETFAVDARAKIGMLRIRESQMEALDDYARDDFFRRACTFLRDFAGADLASLDDARLLAGVKTACAIASSHGVVAERAMMMWLCLQIMAGARFYELPEVAALLRSGRAVDNVLRELYDRLAALQIRRGKPG
jgi:hypothetical protein